MSKRPGQVFLVGAGPGDPGMLTLRGASCLRQADVVLYDYLVNPELLHHCQPGTELISLGSHAQGKLWSQAEINGAIVQHATQGQRVVRLKGGDPAIFARTAEEVDALTANGIPFEIVPGITTALAAGSCAGVPITHRNVASAVAIVTGHECREKQQSSLDFRSLAQFPGTLVIYMGTTTVRAWSQALMENGKAADTPVAVIRHCSLPDQSQFHCRLDEVADRVENPVKLRPPVIFIVGEVARPGRFDAWFQNRPLFGQRIWVCRPREQGEITAAGLRELGAAAEVVPAIEVAPIADPQPLELALSQLDEIDWLVFVSTNGVRFFIDRLHQSGRDVRALASTRLAAIGNATAEQLMKFGLRADCKPVRFDSEGLAEILAQNSGPAQRFLLIRASRGRDVLPKELNAAGHRVEQVAAYENRDAIIDDPNLKQQLSNGEIDWILVTSPAIARSLVNNFGESLREAKLASLSPITSNVLAELQFPPQLEAPRASLEHLIEAICDHVRKSHES